MCSFIFSTTEFDLPHDCNTELKKRGPDYTSHLKIGRFTVTHNLLSITGDLTPQPIIKNNTLLVFNGEIYNYRSFGSYPSDGPALLDGYLAHGLNFFSMINGEYSILIYDLDREEIVSVTDTFGTKPFWIGRSGENFGFSSLKSGLEKLNFHEIEELPPNSITVYDSESSKIKRRIPGRFFDLSQGSKSLDDWCESFEEAISLRSNASSLDKNLFIGLSTGYDSGAIAAALCAQKRQFLALSVVDPILIDQYLPRTQYITSQADHYYILDNRKSTTPEIDCERYDYSIFSMKGDYIEKNINNHNDSGGKGLWLLCDKAKKLNYKVYLSGSGADEICSDYGWNGKRLFTHSNFGGKFPTNLRSVFPWPSFFGSSMRSYLRKEEYISGSFGIEGRYPFLDPDLVQTFLSLSEKDKNSKYKSPIDYYLTQKDFPCTRSVKYGF